MPPGCPTWDPCERHTLPHTLTLKLCSQRFRTQKTVREGKKPTRLQAFRSFNIKGLFNCPSSKAFWSQSSTPGSSSWLSREACGPAPGPGDKHHPHAGDLHPRPGAREGQGEGVGAGAGAAATSRNSQPQSRCCLRRPPGTGDSRAFVPARFRKELGRCRQKEDPTPRRLPSEYSRNQPGRYSPPSNFFSLVIYNLFVLLWSQERFQVLNKEDEWKGLRKDGCQLRPGLRSGLWV